MIMIKNNRERLPILMVDPGGCPASAYPVSDVPPVQTAADRRS